MNEEQNNKLRQSLSWREEVSLKAVQIKISITGNFNIEDQHMKIIFRNNLNNQDQNLSIEISSTVVMPNLRNPWMLVLDKRFMIKLD